MNQVEIKYSYFSQKAELNINGEKASPYSEVITVLNRPFLEAASYIIRGLDNEVFDDYEIDLYATNFQYKLLLSMVQESEYCKAIHFNEIKSMISKEELIQRVSSISNQHNIFVDKRDIVQVYCVSNDVSVPQTNAFCTTNMPNADIGIFEGVETIPSTIRIPILLSDSFGIEKKMERICYCIPKNEMNLFWEYYELDSIIIPMITKYLTALRYVKLSSIQKAEINAIRDNKPGYYIGEVPSTMDQGESVCIEFASFPSQSYMLKSEDSNIVTYHRNTMTANSPGIANLFISNKKGEIVASKTVNVISHQYAEEIRLIPRFDYLKRSERNRIDVIINPFNAEDAKNLIWEISNPDIIQADENGNVIALEEGKTTIRVSGRNTSATLGIEVKPILQGLYFSQQSVRLKSGESLILDCNVTPSEAPTENLTWELDNKTIASINPSKDGKRCQIIACTSYEGKGNVRCYDSNTKLGAICNIEVISKVKQSAAGKIALWCWLIGIIMPFLLPISAIASIYGILCDSEPERSARYIVCAVGSSVILLFWIMAGIG